MLRFDKPSGEPIALFINYAVHAVVVAPDNTQVTGDLSGAASRWVEQRYGNKLVALWTSGPAGDQNLFAQNLLLICRHIFNHQNTDKDKG